VQRFPVDARQPDEHERIRRVVVRDVVRVRCILEQQFALFQIDANHQRSRFRRGVAGNARHEHAAHLKYCLAIVPDCGFDAGQCQADFFHECERICHWYLRRV